MAQGNLAAVDAHENWPFFAVDRNRVLRSAIWPPAGWPAFFERQSREYRVKI
jgi:hypothetical protein